jgi:hypothetical protein
LCPVSASAPYAAGPQEIRYIIPAIAPGGAFLNAGQPYHCKWIRARGFLCAE